MSDKPLPVLDAETWAAHDAAGVVDTVLSDVSLWDTDLTQLPGFAAAVKENLETLINKGVQATLAQSGKLKKAL